ncbi:MAG TPA: hypothetical protein VGF30_09360 [Bacteroidia bacterium]
MKTLRSKLYGGIILVALLIVPFFQSCKKYPDGPGFSVRTRKERVTNDWKVENYKINDRDFTSLVSAYTESYTKNGGYAYFWGSASGSGSWEFQNHDEEIKLTGTDDHASRRLYILKLEEKQFWYYYMDGSDRCELHLIEQ